MFATHYSGIRPVWTSAVSLAALCWVTWLGSTGVVLAAAVAADSPAARAEAEFASATQQLGRSPTNHAALAEYARAAFERADYSTNDTERAALAVQGIAASRKLLSFDPKSAAGHYYLGLNLGQMARTKLLGALRIVDEMEQTFKAARGLNEQIEHAGPDRCLGMLYFQAPAIGSIGSRSKARKHLERAVELAPDFPPNRLELAAAYLKWRDKAQLRRELEAIAKLWPQARTNLPNADWSGWSHQWLKLKEDAAGLLAR